MGHQKRRSWCRDMSWWFTNYYKLLLTGTTRRTFWYVQGTKQRITLQTTNLLKCVPVQTTMAATCNNPKTLTRVLELHRQSDRNWWSDKEERSQWMWKLGDTMMKVNAGGAASPPPPRTDTGSSLKPLPHTSDMLRTLLQGQQGRYSPVAVLTVTKDPLYKV
jgi:hypothetical protein